MENFTNGYTANRLSDITLYRPQARKSLLMLSRSLLIGLWISLGWFGAIQAQTNLSGVINTYAPVTTVSGNNITIGASLGAAHTFIFGDYVLIAQMTGNTEVNGGHYDMLRVTAVVGSSVTVYGASLAGRYDPSTEKVQLVYVPYDATGFTVTGIVTPLAWNGTVGGIVTAYTPGTITMNANIDASCSGFRVGDVALSGGKVYYGGGTGGTYRSSGGSGGSYGVPGYRGYGDGDPDPTSVRADGTYHGGVSKISISFAHDAAGAGGGAGAGSGGGGGGGSTTGGGGGGGASPTHGGCGGSTGVSGGVGSVAGVGGTDGKAYIGSWVNNGSGGGGSMYASGGGGGSYSSDAGGKAGINGGGGGSSQGGGAGGAGGAGTTGFPYFLSATGYINFLNTNNPRAQMGGAATNKNGGGIVFLQAAQIVGNSKSILANGCDDVAPAYGGGSGAGTIIAAINSFSSATSIIAKGGMGANATTSSPFSGQYADGGSGGGGGGAIWVNSTTAANNINSSLQNPSIPNVTFNTVGGTGGIGVVNSKTSQPTGSGGCGGAGIVYTSPFTLISPCTAGITAPTLSATTKSNICPATTADISGLVTSTCPAGSVLEWHTTNSILNLSTANKVANSTTVAAGTYYAVCYDATNTCYSPATAGVTVGITPCSDVSIVKTGPSAIAPNGILSYTLVITNNGPASADNSTVMDENVLNFTPNTIVCSGISGSAVCPTLANLTIGNLQAGSIVIPTLPNGGSVTLTVNGTAGASGSITNVATVTLPTGITEISQANNTSSAMTTIGKTCAAITIPQLK